MSIPPTALAFARAVAIMRREGTAVKYSGDTTDVRDLLAHLSLPENDALRQGLGGDQLPRLAAADALDDAGRPFESQLLRDPHQHVVIDGSGVRPGAWNLYPVIDAWQRVRDLVYDHDLDHLVPGGLSWAAAGPHHTAVYHPVAAPPGTPPATPVAVAHNVNLGPVLAEHVHALLGGAAGPPEFHAALAALAASRPREVEGKPRRRPTS